MDNGNKGSLQPYNTVNKFENLTPDGVSLFVDPSLKKMIREVEKILMKAIKKGELKGFNYLEFRLETNVYKELI